MLQGNGQSSSYTAASGGTLQVAGATLVLNYGSLTAQTGGAVEYNGATINGGFLRGSGIHMTLPGGMNNFNGVTTYNSTVFQQDGPANFTNFTNGGELTNNAPMTWNGGTNASSGQLNVNGTCNVQDFSNDGMVTINSGGELNDSVSNAVSGGGSQITINSGGTLNADNAGQGVSLNLQESLLVNNGVVTGTTNVGYLAKVSGSGAFDLLTLSDGGTLDLIAQNANVSDLTGAGTVNHSGTGSSNSLIVGSGDFGGMIENYGGRLALLKTGSGELILSGSSDYTGGTTVSAGTLDVANPAALPSGTSLTVGRNALSIFDASELAAPSIAEVAAIPEPSTLALLAAGAVGLLGYARRWCADSRNWPKAGLVTSVARISLWKS